jgi:spermidine/putrescine transport system permease protein
LGSRRYLILPFIAWFFLFVLGPFSLLISLSLFSDVPGSSSFGFQAYGELFHFSYLQMFFRTFLFSFLHSSITVLLALPIAFYLSRLERKEAGTYLTFLLIPFWTNFLIRLLSFQDVLRLEPFGLQWTFTFHGMVAAMVYNGLPFAILPLYAAMEKIPNSLLEAAQDLGASKRYVIFSVLWPLLKWPLFATSLLVFIPAMGEFLVPEMVGGGQTYYLGTFLQRQFLVAQNWPLGAAAISVLLFFSALLLWVGAKAMEDQV